MSRRILTWCLLGAAAATALRADDEDFLDRVDDALTFSSQDHAIRMRVSGALDLEGYVFGQRAPALIDAEGSSLFNPRLSTFVDVQAGPAVYAFAQWRVDRGFDPAAEPLRGRVDEYAVRVTPWADGRFSVQAGKFAAVVGNWIPRHGSWDNPFISAPLPYEHQTAIWDSVAARSTSTLLVWAHLQPGLPEGGDKYLRVPIVWGPSYAPGVSVSGIVGKMEFAAELKEASLSSRPSVWDENAFRWGQPTTSARLGYRPNMMWQFGASFSRGTYLSEEAAPTLPAGEHFSDYRETVFGQDVSFAWHHLQVWAEVFETRFEIPRVGSADTWAYYVETRYKFTPRFAGAVRWNQQFFGSLRNGSLGRVHWGSDVWRFDVASSFRFTPHTEIKLELSLAHDPLRASGYAPLAAVQWVVRF